MMEHIYDTYRALLHVELPKNNEGNIVVYDRAIVGWNYGDRKLKPGTPAITFQSESTPQKKVAFGVYELEHKMLVRIDVASDSKTATEHIIQEMSRLVYEALLPHRYIWVLTPCPFCMKRSLSPEHYTIAHTSLMAPYVAAVDAEAQALWAETHNDAAPALANSRRATAAFYKLLADYEAGNTVSGLTAPQSAALDAVLANKMRPVRLLYDVEYASAKQSDGGVEKQFFHNGEFAIIAKEAIKQPVPMGPDNVPTDAFDWNKS